MKPIRNSTETSREHWLPHAVCNLRRNPFGELTREERVQLAVVDVQRIAEQVSEPRTAVQLIGGCGRGKTTRLLALAYQFSDAHYVYLPEEGGCPPIAEGSPLLVDEAQRLPRAVCRSLFAVGVPLVLATHRNLKSRLSRFGYQVQNEWIGAENTPQLVCRLLNRRIEASRLHSGPVPRISLQSARTLVGQFGSDIRGIEGFLYEQFQSQVMRHGKVRSIDRIG